MPNSSARPIKSYASAWLDHSVTFVNVSKFYMQINMQNELIGSYTKSLREFKRETKLRLIEITSSTDFVSSTTIRILTGYYYY